MCINSTSLKKKGGRAEKLLGLYKISYVSQKNTTASLEICCYVVRNSIDNLGNRIYCLLQEDDSFPKYTWQ